MVKTNSNINSILLLVVLWSFLNMNVFAVLIDYEKSNFHLRPSTEAVAGTIYVFDIYLFSSASNKIILSSRAITSSMLNNP